MYRCDEQGINWSELVKELRCLWCRDWFYRFSDADELVHHLRTFHAKFCYHFPRSGPRSANANPCITMNMALSTGGHTGALSSLDMRADYHTDYEYVNVPAFLNATRRRTRTKPAPSSRPFLLAGSPRPSPAASQAARGSAHLDVKKRSIDETTDVDYRPTRATKRLSEGKKKRKTGNPAFKSISAAIQNDRLYHSVLQQRLSLHGYNEGADSDAESDDQEELKWRSKIVEDEIEEFVDTIAVEKLFMCLWNQFAKMDNPIRADREVAPACLRFVQLYRKTLTRYSLEVTFLRHLTEFARIGVLDADSVFEIMQQLRKQDSSAAPDGPDEPRFLYGERLKLDGADGKRFCYQ